MRFALLFLALILASCAGLPTSPEGKRGLFELGASAPSPSRSVNSNPSCQPLTRAQREELLSLANPDHFLGVRYRKGGRDLATATDCSHFVHQIYARAGLPYGFRPTRELRNAPEFELLPESEALPGDLMLFRGHVGIVDQDGWIISATRIRSRSQPSTITRQPREVFPGFRGRRYVLRYRCQPEDSALAARP